MEHGCSLATGQATQASKRLVKHTQREQLGGQCSHSVTCADVAPSGTGSSTTSVSCCNAEGWAAAASAAELAAAAASSATDRWCAA